VMSPHSDPSMDHTIRARHLSLTHRTIDSLINDLLISSKCVIPSGVVTLQRDWLPPVWHLCVCVWCGVVWCVCVCVCMCVCGTCSTV
jgi:hypothetical protein